jgi:hypothetical protein
LYLKIKIDVEFRAICLRILEEEYSNDEWSLLESDDMFSSTSYVGGYDADEDAFCFSFYTKDGLEYWFQIDLNEVKDIANYKINFIDSRPAEY